MTAQASEVLIYKENEFTLASDPLSDFIKANELDEFEGPSSDCWRGYIGYWKISEGKLFITNLEGDDRRFGKFGLDYLFPNEKEVFADWFSGELSIPLGELVEYVHAGYCSSYEKYLVIKVNNGIITKQVLINNKSEKQTTKSSNSYGDVLDLTIKNRINNSSLIELIEMFTESIKQSSHVKYSQARKVELNDSNKHYSRVDIRKWNPKEKEKLYNCILKGLNIFYFVINDLELLPIGAFNSVMNAINGNTFIYINKMSIKWLPKYLKELIKEQGIKFKDLSSSNIISKPSYQNDTYSSDENMIYAAGSNDPELMAEAFSNIRG